ncbi:MAG: DUF4105 domain-containing protein [Cyclobacteriaceae bacterium]|nr:DUF4105 domain-containing protein [Cyclobacteriaceae bacterium]
MEYLKFFFLLFLVSLHFKVSSQNFRPEQEPPLSEKATISLITGEPGNELYASFGHSAIRVHDPETGYDKVYNYGTFDFDQQGFYINFMRGKLNYSLSRYDFARMNLVYKFLNQALFEQVLNLTYEQKRMIFEYLNTNYLPENRFYLYDFFYDNCSSRIRDVFKTALGAELVFEDDYIGEHKTFRQLLDEYIQDFFPWGDFGIDLALGMPADKTASSENYMFLPLELYRAFDHAYVISDGDRRPFVASNQILVNPVKIEKKGFSLTPMVLFSGILLLMIFLTLYESKFPVDLRRIDSILFLIVGFAGLIIALLWFATDHITTKNNLNLLWAFPLHLLAPVLIYHSKFLKFSIYYFLFWSIFLTLFLIGWNYMPQQLHLAIIPVLLLLIMRSYRRYQKNKKTYEQYVDRKK